MVNVQERGKVSVRFGSDRLGRDEGRRRRNSRRGWLLEGNLLRFDSFAKLVSVSRRVSVEAKGQLSRNASLEASERKEGEESKRLQLTRDSPRRVRPESSSSRRHLPSGDSFQVRYRDSCRSCWPQRSRYSSVEVWIPRREQTSAR